MDDDDERFSIQRGKTSAPPLICTKGTNLTDSGDGHEMSIDKLEVDVTFDPKRGYIASALELREPVVALSLGGLRLRIEIAMLPDEPIIALQLDALAERERHRRRAQAQLAR